MKFFFILSLWTMLSLPGFASGEALDFPFGVEFEYRDASSSLRNSHDEAMKSLMMYPIRQFQGSSKDIQMVRWEKFPELNLTNARYRDPHGKEWNIYPEQVNRDYVIDGYELVSPPFSSSEDVDHFEEILKNIDRDQRFVEGAQSSTHFTFDVSRLIRADGNANELVNAILFIESHWPEIYSAMGPQRYGTSINVFSVPLSLDHPSLLRELSTLPKKDRTMKNVGEIFRKYDALEKKLHADLKQAWKYRAANYGRLFGLGKFEGNPHSLLEIRIADLAKSHELKPMSRFLSSVIRTGASKPQPFIDRFRGVSRDIRNRNDFVAANRRIEELRKSDYKRFLREIGLSEETHPRRISQAPGACLNFLRFLGLKK